MRRGEQRMREGDVCARRTRTRDAVDVQAASFSSRVSEAQSERRRVREMGYTKEEQRAKRGSARAQGQSRCRPSDGARRYNKGKPNKMESVGRETGELSPFELTIKPVDGPGRSDGSERRRTRAARKRIRSLRLAFGRKAAMPKAQAWANTQTPSLHSNLAHQHRWTRVKQILPPQKRRPYAARLSTVTNHPGDGKPATELRIGWITYEHAWVLPANWAQLNLPVAPFAAALQCDPTDDIPISIYLIPQPGARLYFFKAHIALKKRNFFVKWLKWLF
ncbi:hypothetical protein B0H10DRAFT_2200420 [Mycena sp. CBHHK59/15]|nr:hypothetical protein B0H10DRAFT_2200420 [Mycena sp. CBHHK59/15]